MTEGLVKVRKLMSFRGCNTEACESEVVDEFQGK